MKGNQSIPGKRRQWLAEAFCCTINLVLTVVILRDPRRKLWETDAIPVPALPQIFLQVYLPPLSKISSISLFLKMLAQEIRLNRSPTHPRTPVIFLLFILFHLFLFCFEIQFKRSLATRFSFLGNKIKVTNLLDKLCSFFPLKFLCVLFNSQYGCVGGMFETFRLFD